MTPLTYQDALDLKKCGFPQKVLYGDTFWDTNNIQFQPYQIGNSDDMDKTTGGWNPALNRENDTAKPAYVKVPSLGELVRECGEGFDSLSIAYDEGKPYWWASASGEKIREFSGSTPEQAVKNLYCALHKKI